MTKSGDGLGEPFLETDVNHGNNKVIASNDVPYLQEDTVIQSSIPSEVVSHSGLSVIDERELEEGKGTLPARKLNVDFDKSDFSSGWAHSMFAEEQYQLAFDTSQAVDEVSQSHLFALASHCGDHQKPNPC